MTRARTLPDKATPRGRFPHVRLAGGFAYVSGTSARRPDNTIAGADVDPLGTATLDIRVQTRAVIEDIQDISDVLFSNSHQYSVCKTCGNIL